jgi:hypothetical protein
MRHRIALLVLMAGFCTAGVAIAQRPAIQPVQWIIKESAQLTEHSMNAQHPAWSPDGKWLVFSAQVDERPDVFGLARISVPKLPR